MFTEHLRGTQLSVHTACEYIKLKGVSELEEMPAGCSWNPKAFAPSVRKELRNQAVLLCLPSPAEAACECSLLLLAASAVGMRGQPVRHEL